MTDTVYTIAETCAETAAGKALTARAGFAAMAVRLCAAATIMIVAMILSFAGGISPAAAQADYDYYYWDDGSAAATQPAPQPAPQAQQSQPRQNAQPAPSGAPQRSPRQSGGPDFSQAADDEYRLGSGDQVRVTVFGHEDLSGQFEVDGSGYASLPLIGEMRVGGYSTRQVEEMIEQSLSPNYLRNPRVGVEVLNYRPFYILGEVAKPGSYPFVSGMRVINAVALAGGYTYRAQKKGIKIERAVNGDMETADHNSVVLPGDIVHVPERFF